MIYWIPTTLSSLHRNIAIISLSRSFRTVLRVRKLLSMLIPSMPCEIYSSRAVWQSIVYHSFQCTICVVPRTSMRVLVIMHWRMCIKNKRYCVCIDLCIHVLVCSMEAVTPAHSLNSQISSSRPQRLNPASFIIWLICWYTFFFLVPLSCIFRRISSCLHMDMKNLVSSSPQCSLFLVPLGSVAITQ